MKGVMIPSVEGTAKIQRITIVNIYVFKNLTCFNFQAMILPFYEVCWNVELMARKQFIWKANVENK